MSPLWREHGKGDAGGGIHVAICCCNEEEEELQVSAKSKHVGRSAPPNDDHLSYHTWYQVLDVDGI